MPSSEPAACTNQLQCSTSPLKSSAADRPRTRAIAYEKFGRWFDAEEPLLRAKERTDAGSSPFRHPRSELIAPLLQEAPSAFNNRKLHMRLPCGADGPDGHRPSPEPPRGRRPGDAA